MQIFFFSPTCVCTPHCVQQDAFLWPGKKRRLNKDPTKCNHRFSPGVSCNTQSWEYSRWICCCWLQKLIFPLRKFLLRHYASLKFEVSCLFICLSLKSNLLHVVQRDSLINYTEARRPSSTQLGWLLLPGAAAWPFAAVPPLHDPQPWRRQPGNDAVGFLLLGLQGLSV